MDKLELKDLAPYLPYGLMVSQYREDLKISIESELVSLSADKMRVLLTRFPYSEDVAYNEIKPILRPLSDLTKEIEHDDKKYCIMSLWFSVDVREENDFEVLGKIPDYWKTVINAMKSNGIKHIDYGFINILLEHHFDVFGLIEKGLAIDINSLKS